MNESLFLTLGLSYLFGSVPFGLVLTRLAGLGDVRKIGSGNIGATNVLRTGNKALALATLMLDGGKGAIAVLVAFRLAPEYAAFGGLAAFIGHVHPVWLRFKGGKGVATFLGLLLAFSPLLGLAAGATWLGAFLLFRISSLSALIAAAFTPFYVHLMLGDLSTVIAVSIMTLLIFYYHRENIARIKAGTEPRVGQKKNSE